MRQFRAKALAFAFIAILCAPAAVAQTAEELRAMHRALEEAAANSDIDPEAARRVLSRSDTISFAKTAYRENEPEDRQFAFQTATDACDLDSFAGCDILGRLILEGRVAGKSASDAIAPHRKAAQLGTELCTNPQGSGYIDSCFLLSHFYARAASGVRDEARAQTYMDRAKAGLEKACSAENYSAMRIYHSDRNMPYAFHDVGPCTALAFQIIPRVTGGGFPAAALGCRMYMERGGTMFDMNTERNEHAACINGAHFANHPQKSLEFYPVESRFLAKAACDEGMRQRFSRDYTSDEIADIRIAACGTYGVMLYGGYGGDQDEDKGLLMGHLACILEDELACTWLDEDGLHSEAHERRALEVLGRQG